MADADLSVVICAYSPRRWDDLCAAVASVRDQHVPPREVIVVIDHHPELLARAAAEFGDVHVLPNAGPKGLSGARNTGIGAAAGAIIAFLDDDAVADAEWTARLVEAYEDDDVLGVGGWADPAWDGPRPTWFPEEFLWVVGCSYRGLPRSRGVVRNLIGCNMSIRADVLDAVGGFDVDLGRTADRPLGCEETELCIRSRDRFPAGRFLLEPRAIVRHRVPVERSTWSYFVDRCRSEGVSKAWVAERVGKDSALASERAHTLRVLPAGVARGLASVRPSDASGAARGASIVAGLGITASSYVLERRTLARSGRDDQDRRAGETTSVLPVVVDLAAPIPPLAPADVTMRTARCLVVLRGTLVGLVEVGLGDGIPAAELADLLWARLGPDIVRVAVGAGLPEPTFVPVGGLTTGATTRVVEQRATVVIATRDRADRLERCLMSILDAAVVPAHLIVVDNAPSDDRTRALLERLRPQHPTLTYQRETRAGLGRAHNAALPEVTTELVAFTDDDVVVHPWWLARLVDAFDATEDVVCVTGMIAPLELETAAQQLIEATAGFNKGGERRVFGRAGESHGALYPYAAGAFGSGANMAFRTDYLRSAGGFDEALGAGTVALGGDDLAAFYDVVRAGHRLVYEPAAIVSHLHHRTIEALERQAYGYGAGLSAHLLRCVLHEPRVLIDMASRIPAGIRRARSIAHPTPTAAPTPPPGLARHHWRGMAAGPSLYLRSRRAVRTTGATDGGVSDRGAA